VKREAAPHQRTVVTGRPVSREFTPVFDGLLPGDDSDGIVVESDHQIREIIMTLRVSLGALSASLVFAACSSSANAADTGAPATPVAGVSDVYHGVTVVDPYRWLENGSDPKVHEWSVEQDNRTRAYLDGLAVRKPIYDRLFKLNAQTSPSYSGLHPAGDRIFAIYSQPPKQQPMIAMLGRDADPANARVIVDPNTLDPAGTTAIDWFVPSPDGTRLAASLSERGSEDGSLHVFDVATGKETGEVIPRVQYPTGGGSAAWAADGTGFYYTRYPGPDRPADEQHFFQRIYFHTVGADPAGDVYVAGQDFPKVAEIALDNSQNYRVVVASVANGDGGEFAHYLIGPGHRVTQVTRFEDKVVAAVAGPDDNLYLVSRKDAPHGKLLRLPLADPLLAHAIEIVPQGEPVLQGGGEFGGVPVVVTRTGFYVRELVGGPSQVARFDLDGRPRGILPTPEVAATGQVVPAGDGTILYSVSTYLRPTYYGRFDESSARSEVSKLAQSSPVRFDDAEVVRALVTSNDGTKVPITIIRKIGTRLDRANPVLLTGYGGYSISLTPRFLGADRRLWLDGGGAYVIANLRGGGEYGEEWHRQGALTHKQNVFDDFIATARYLIDQGYTTPARLAILGGSNGGLLMGAAFTQHPELFRAVVSQVGIYDMLRVELDPNGLFNTTEFGSVKDIEQFKALYAYSPYHHVVAGTKYPAIFMATGENDGRVNPMHSRKMIARLQAATSGGPVYLSINSLAGHGIGSALSIRVNQSADYTAFLFDQLGMTLAAE
jgi:prolyl oligopeptidase